MEESFFGDKHPPIIIHGHGMGNEPHEWGSRRITNGLIVPNIVGFVDLAHLLWIIAILCAHGGEDF